jgi:hypothetical protein
MNKWRLLTGIQRIVGSFLELTSNAITTLKMIALTSVLSMTVLCAITVYRSTRITVAAIA